MNDEHLEKLLREIDEEDDYAWLKETNAELREKIGILFNKNKQLETENAALRKDKERLDFLQRVAEEGGFQCFGIEDSALLDFEFSNRENETSDLVRAAIDAARAKEYKL